MFYTTNPSLPIASWDSQVVDHSLLTTISDLTPHTIYTIRVQAETSVGSGPLSTPVQVKTQHGVPSQPTGLRAIDVSARSVSLEWARPHHTGENINSYELYWNDTFTKVRVPVRRLHARHRLFINDPALAFLFPLSLCLPVMRSTGEAPPVAARLRDVHAHRPATEYALLHLAGRQVEAWRRSDHSADPSPHGPIR